MHHVGRAARQLHQRLGLEHVDLVEREVRVLMQVSAGQRIAVQVVDRDDLVVLDEPPRERRRDEARAAGDHDSLPLEHEGKPSGRGHECRCVPGGPQTRRMPSSSGRPRTSKYAASLRPRPAWFPNRRPRSNS